MIHHHLHAPSQPSQWASSELLQSQNLLIYQFHPDHHLVQDLIGTEPRQHLVWKKKKKNWQYQDNRWDNNNNKKGHRTKATPSHLLLHVLPRESSHDLKSNNTFIQEFFFIKKEFYTERGTLISTFYTISTSGILWYNHHCKTREKDVLYYAYLYLVQSMENKVKNQSCHLLGVLTKIKYSEMASLKHP